VAPPGNTSVSDAGLTHLKEIKSLTSLDVKKTKVTAKGLEALPRPRGHCPRARSRTTAAPSSRRSDYPARVRCEMSRCNGLDRN